MQDIPTRKQQWEAMSLFDKILNIVFAPVMAVLMLMLWIMGSKVFNWILGLFVLATAAFLIYVGNYECA